MANTAVYKLLKNDRYGRYMAANRFIKQGEMILKENPIIVGAQLGGPITCFGCCTRLKEFTVCSRCKIAPICNEKCSGMFHSDEECLTLKNHQIKSTDLSLNGEMIMPLRCLLFRAYDEGKWAILMSLESHLEARRNSAIWRRHKVNVEDVLKQFGIIDDCDLKSEIIQRICGAIDVKSFEVRPKQNHDNGTLNQQPTGLRGLYPKTASISHDCVANTHITVDDDFVLSVHAAVDIAEGEPISYNYASILEGRAERQRRLKEGKYFECACRRCLDSTELGTEMSSLICPRCRKGYIRPKKTIENDSWECFTCQRSYLNSLVNMTVEEARRRIYAIDSPNIAETEKLLHKFKQTFHPHHHVILNIEQNLIKWYNYCLPKNKNLIRKIEICSKLLKLYRILEPGISRIQAITLYELHSAQVTLAQKEHNNKEISQETLIEKLSASEKTLKEAIQFLLYEPQNSPEGRLAQNALAELKMLRLSIKNIQNSCDTKEMESNKQNKKKKGKNKAKLNK